MRYSCLIVAMLFGIMLESQRSEAQYTNNYQTNIISGVTSNWAGDYIVGSNTFADVLLIQNSGVLTNRYGYLGYEVNSSNNSVLVTGTNSVWNNSGDWGEGGDLFVGYSGAGNSLVISNSGQVVNGYGYVGYNSSSSNNSALVTGAGSVWSNGYTLYVGDYGPGNSLVISNGGQVVSGWYGYGPGYVGYDSGSSNNSALVTGAGSVWSNGCTLYVGNYGPDNSLVIGNGGQVVSDGGDVGYNSSSSNSSVLVTGTNSVWKSGSLHVGCSGSGNSLVIDNGGQVVSDGGDVGSNSGNSNNSVLVTGTGSVWSNSGDLSVGPSGACNSLVISNCGQVVNAYGYVGSWGGSSNSVVVTGSGSVWNNSGELDVGYGSSSNSLVINNGGKVASDGLRISSDYGQNSLVISNGGQLVNNYGYVGYNSGSGNNSVLVTGSGSLWNDSQNVYVGYSGASNSLTVAGGSVLASNMVVGYRSSALSNSVEVNSGSVFVTNSLGTGSLRIQRGKLILNGGTVTVDALFATMCSNSVVQFNGGVLNSAGTSIANGQTFFVGNGTNVAKFHLLGGVHWFAGEGPCEEGCGGGGVSVDIYSNFTMIAGGAPYSNWVGQFHCPGVSFATDNGYEWHPFDLFEFGADITGSLSVASNGNYTFYLDSDDGSLLIIDGSLVVANGDSHGPKVASGSATLTAGVHPFEVQFFECCSGQSGVDLILPAGISYFQTNSIGLGLDIRANGLLSGCGTINGSVLVDSDALVLANCGGTLTFTGILTNNGTMRSVNGSVLEFYGPVVNNGIIDIMDGTTNFHSSFINNGTVVDASYFRVVGITRQADDINITWTTVGGDSYVVQVTAGAADGSYSNNFTDRSPVIGIPGASLGTTNYLDIDGATNMPARYYRIQLSSPLPPDP